ALAAVHPPRAAARLVMMSPPSRPDDAFSDVEDCSVDQTRPKDNRHLSAPLVPLPQNPWRFTASRQRCPDLSSPRPNHQSALQAADPRCRRSHGVRLVERLGTRKGAAFANTVGIV